MQARHNFSVAIETDDRRTCKSGEGYNEVNPDSCLNPTSQAKDQKIDIDRVLSPDNQVETQEDRTRRGIVISIVTIIAGIILIIGLALLGSIRTSPEISRTKSRSISQHIPITPYKPLSGNFHINYRKELRIKEKLGSGGFGCVYRAYWKPQKYKGVFGWIYFTLIQKSQVVAVKKLPTDGNTNYAIESLSQEINVLCRAENECILRCYGACQEQDNICLVLEFAPNGDLSRFIHNGNEKIPYEEILRIAFQLAEGLGYLHPHVLHRDLKPQNVLLDENYNVKLADFGLAKMKENTYITKQARNPGTSPYMAPEVLGSEKDVDDKCDIYALGMVIWEMYTRQRPWMSKIFHEQIQHQVENRENRPIIPQDCPEDLANLITRCWAQDPKKRPSAKDVQYEIKKIQTKIIKQEIPNKPPKDDLLFKFQNADQGLPSSRQQKQKCADSEFRMSVSFPDNDSFLNDIKRVDGQVQETGNRNDGVWVHDVQNNNSSNEIDSPIFENSASFGNNSSLAQSGHAADSELAEKENVRGTPNMQGGSGEGSPDRDTKGAISMSLKKGPLQAENIEKSPLLQISASGRLRKLTVNRQKAEGQRLGELQNQINRIEEDQYVNERQEDKSSIQQSIPRHITGSLRTFIHSSHEDINEQAFRTIVRNIVIKLGNLSSEVVHENLKPSNIQLHDAYDVELINVGSLQSLRGKDKQDGSDVEPNIVYAAPEVISRDYTIRQSSRVEVTKACAIYSLGVIMWEMCTKREPWAEEDKNSFSIPSKVAVSKKTLPIPEQCPAYLKELMQKCWAWDAKERPTAEEIRQCLQ
eukprot:TRINITY_DN7514_c0_g2_i7.p1 TRINITY_DN7514_c0_g2~~TRINITY_DN7514_c0_g2_i7.p1  ORF type:complete len:812 (+),score=47.70 TRINITY_DN7514_c0_g2_i7:3-2438(+)